MDGGLADSIRMVAQWLFAPRNGDFAHRNDSFEPREVSAYVRHGANSPILVSHETCIFTHAYDSIGNHVLFSDNLTTNTFSHNQANQMVGRVVLNAPSTAFAYTPDGGLSSDGDWDYA